MADVYQTPGVYVKEIATFPPSIAEVETAIPAFIGYTATALKNGVAVAGEAVRVTSLLEYEDIFGKAQPEENITVTVTDETDEGALVRRTVGSDTGEVSPYIMYYCMQMYFANGGGPCYVVSVGSYEDEIDNGDANGGITMGIDRLETVDEPTIIVLPDAVALADGDYYNLLEHALDQCARLQDRVVVGDVKQADEPDPLTDAATMRSSLAGELDTLKYGAVYYPYLQTSLNYYFNEEDVTVTHSVDGTDTESTLAALKNSNTELYNLAKAEIDKHRVVLPPSSSVAGVCARVDSTRGVWKAPANVALRLVDAAAVKITDAQQAGLNVDATSGKSVNAIRFFTGKGVLVWGARTLAGNDNEWRYFSVRRFFNFAEESIRKGSQWVVFEPNDANTWIRVKAMIENFLIKQWRAGALAGSTPEQAFFVKIGLGLTMTALDILEGRMNIEIGMAVVRPAEFIILKFSHKMQES